MDKGGKESQITQSSSLHAHACKPIEWFVFVCPHGSKVGNETLTWVEKDPPGGFQRPRGHRQSWAGSDTWGLVAVKQLYTNIDFWTLMYFLEVLVLLGILSSSSLSPAQHQGFSI